MIGLDAIVDTARFMLRYQLDCLSGNTLTFDGTASQPVQAHPSSNHPTQSTLIKRAVTARALMCKSSNSKSAMIVSLMLPLVY